MFHTLPPTQTRFPASRSQVAFGKAASPKSPAQYPEKYPKLDAEILPGDDKFIRAQGALKEAMKKYQYTINEDLYSNYRDRLTFNRARNQIHHLWKNVDGDVLRKFHDTDKLGLVEESSDMFFEMYTLKALNMGLITKDQVKGWAKDLPREFTDVGDAYNPQLSGEMFDQFRERILRDIQKRAKEHHPNRLERFRKMVNKDWSAKVNGQDADRALDMLSLIGMKCALMTKKDSNYNLKWDNIKLLCAEGEELREEMHGDGLNSSPTKWLVNGLAKAYSCFPWLPAGLFRGIITKVVRDELDYQPKGAQQSPDKFDIKYKDLMETVFSKQIGRQELDFSRPDLDKQLEDDTQINQYKDAMKKGNAKRKCILKPYELWQETAVLQNALANNPNRKEAEEVLNTGA